MKLHWADIVTYASFGLALGTQLAAAGLPAASDALVHGSGHTVANSLSLALVVLGAIVRTANNPTPTNTALVTDHVTGLPVSIATVDKPGNPPK